MLLRARVGRGVAIHPAAPPRVAHEMGYTLGLAAHRARARGSRRCIPGSSSRRPRAVPSSRARATSRHVPRCIGVLSCTCIGAFKRVRPRRGRVLSRAAPARPAGATPAGNYVGSIGSMAVHTRYRHSRSSHGDERHRGLLPATALTTRNVRARGRLDGAALLRKRYVAGTGDPLENFGHTVAIELTC